MGWFSRNKPKEPEVVPVVRIVSLSERNYMQQAFEEAVRKLPEHEQEFFKKDVTCQFLIQGGHLKIHLESTTHTEVR